MKKYLILATLACSLGAAHAQPPETRQPNQPTPEQQAQWQKQWEEQQREELRHPGTMIQAFASAMNNSVFDRAALCVEGASDDATLERWRRIVRDNQGDWNLNITPLFQDAEVEKQGDNCTVQVATSLGLSDATLDQTTQKLILSRLETVDLQREGENWKIVPRAEIRPAKTAVVEGWDSEAMRARQIASAKAQIKTARDENDGILNDWARLMAKSPAQMKEFLGQASASNIKQLLLGSLQLMQDYDETYQFNADNWVEMLAPYVKSQKLFRMPVAENADDALYHFNARLFGKSLAEIAQPARTVAIYEAGAGPGGLSYQHNGQAVVGFVDGHVEFIGPEDLPKIIWEIRPTPSG